MNLSHFSTRPLNELYSVDQTNLKAFFKPEGLWISVDGSDDWPNWCRGNDFGNIDEQVRYRIHLKSDHNLLILTDADEIRAFDKKYKMKKQSPGRPYEIINIHWGKVSEEYQGIIITPYCWELRMEEGFMWYYGWDCASGCIWNADAVEKFEMMEKEAA